eukprot:CAMPEP_0168823108 /NCGR_PEP_ID=MMETSP0726-20121227/10347_1 /TAXON_ID=265536 /ORGANISM="Amphiprora sp., Strain CCMP467" /LENGTH=66 /DNA_ID=CAMNT_0008875945 /DNA_START=57 /DNA_END=254 /DNA_ORIENTATION=-
MTAQLATFKGNKASGNGPTAASQKSPQDSQSSGPAKAFLWWCLVVMFGGAVIAYGRLIGIHIFQFP